MKVLYVTEGIGGVERYLQWLLPLVKERGIEQVLVCPDTYNMSFYGGVECHPLDMSKVKKSPVSVLRLISSVRDIIKKTDPDIVYCHNYGGFIGRFSALGLGKKVIYNSHGWGFKRKDLVGYAHLVAEWLLSFVTDGFVCISKDEMRIGFDKRICSAGKAVLIENGIDVSAVASAQPLRSLLPPVAPGGRVIGMLGRLGEEKNPECFVRMASIVAKKFPNTLFVIIGDGEKRKSVEAMAMDLGVNLFISGWVQSSQAYGLLKCFDVAVLLSRWEGFSLAVLEYMAASRSFVASNVSGISDSVDDGVNGLLVPSDGHEQAADAVIRLLEDPALAASLKKNAFEKVSAKYTLQRVACETAGLFNKLVVK